MSRVVPKSRDLWLVVFVLCGVAVGFGLSRLGTGEPTPLFATASHGTDSLTVATGTIAPSLEIVVVLDHATGELTGYVPNPNSGKFFAKYTYNMVGKDLGVNQSKKPKYSMVTGRAEFRPQGGTNKFGECVVFVTEENSGKIVSYGIPWSGSRLSSNQNSQGNFVKFDTAPIGSGRRGVRR